MLSTTWESTQQVSSHAARELQGREIATSLVDDASREPR
jgi:hypothetical protein